LFRSLSHTRAVLEAWRADYNNERPHSRLGWMSPAIYAAARRSAALRSTDGFAPRTAATTAQQGITDDQTPSSLDKNWGQRHRKAWRNSSPAQGIRILKAIRIFSGAAGGATAAHQYRQRRWSRRNATLPGRPEKLSNYNARK